MASLFVRMSSIEDVDIIQQHIRASVLEAEEYRGSVPPFDPGSESLEFVAGVGESIFGSVVAHSSGDGRWTVAHVYVQPEARGIGLGDSLINALMSTLRARHARWLSGVALPGDRAMKNLFERHGLIAQSITVGRSLSDPSS